MVAMRRQSVGQVQFKARLDNGRSLAMALWLEIKDLLMEGKVGSVVTIFLDFEQAPPISFHKPTQVSLPPTLVLLLSSCFHFQPCPLKTLLLSNISICSIQNKQSQVNCCIASACGLQHLEYACRPAAPHLGFLTRPVSLHLYSRGQMAPCQKMRLES